MGIYENARLATQNQIIEAFWKLYQTKPLDKITVKELCANCGIGRGTFYNHFQDVYAVLESIENMLYTNLEDMSTKIKANKSDFINFSQIVYEYYDNALICEYLRVLVVNHRSPIFAEKYLQILKELLLDAFIEDTTAITSEKDKHLINGTASSLVYILLHSICNTPLSLEEINELIIGLLQNGYYITLTNKFGIKALKNPYLLNN